MVKNNSIKIYHNPRCRKSRQTLDLIHKKNIDVEIIEYLKNPISKTELNKLVKYLGIMPIDLVRKEESLWKEKYKNKILSSENILRIMVENPKLIQRPIVVKNEKAVLGRPPELVLELIS
tara:strand:- start:856 stop:1215 length:360 start_codon:yes stop_codon:yes gene_type:complete